MNRQHHYTTTVIWTGNKGSGTNDFRNYERSHLFKIDNKIDIECSSDTAFRGEATKHNPEDMLLYALSSCHMLWYLHLCADAGVIVTEYTDNATAIMEENGKSDGRFTEATLNPVVKVADASMIEKAESLHEMAHKYCFIANSVNFPVTHKQRVLV